jgi:hypothetical protein
LYALWSGLCVLPSAAVRPTFSSAYGKSLLMCAFMLSMKSPSPDMVRSSAARSAIRQECGTTAVLPACQASIVSKYVCANNASTCVSQVRSEK